MDREILFRGKRMDNGKWVEGWYCPKKTGHYEGDRFVEEMQSVIIASMTGGGYQYAVVDPRTVCQYTGLTDKNGKRFEGDIFQASDGDYIQRYIITWNEDYLEWSAECIGDPDGTLPLSEFRVGEIEVIGNIFDNPALLEGGAE